MMYDELDSIRELAQALHKILLYSTRQIKPGMKSGTLRNKTLSFMQNIAPGSILSSFDMNINEIVCHSNAEEITPREGDIITLDLVICRDGLYADGAWSSICGEGSPEKKELIRKAWEIARTAVLSIEKGDTSLTMKKKIHNSLRGSGFSIIEEACGHGIGRSMHMPPDINFSLLNKEDILWKEGMVFTVEPVLCRGTAKLLQSKEKGWISDNNNDSAYFEHMVAISSLGSECLNIPEIILQNSIDIF